MNWQEELRKQKTIPNYKPSWEKVVKKTFRSQFFYIFALHLVGTVANLCNPIFVQKLLKSIKDGEVERRWFYFLIGGFMT